MSFNQPLPFSEDKIPVSCEFVVDLAAVTDNYRILKKAVGPDVQVAAVVKSDAYGVGVEKVVAALENENCNFYYVARPEEAFRLRRITTKPIGIMNGPYKGIERECLRESIMPVISNFEDLEAFSVLAQKLETRVDVALHVDTGMNRLGFTYEELAKIATDEELVKGLRITMLHSHFACADEPDHDKNPAQIEKFTQAAKLFPDAQRSFSNSSGSFLTDENICDQARAGMALYGLNPVPGQDNPMRPVVSIYARVLQLRTAEKGDSAGYGATYTFEKDTELAVLDIGYANGLHRVLGNTGVVYFRGQACPIVGRVSMDLTIVDISGLDLEVRLGDMMEIIGPHQSADDLAAQAGTIGYEILTSLGARVKRRYVFDKSSAHFAATVA